MTTLQQEQIRAAQEKLAALMEGEFSRIERMKSDCSTKDFSKLDTIVVGIMPGDGIGPVIMEQALRVIRALMAPELASGKLQLRMIDGMTIDNRARLKQTVPDDVLAACRECDVLIKGPFVTPTATDPWPNLPSANATLRRELDLFAAVRPIRIPERGIDWCFFRENIEGEYIWGSKGIRVNDDFCFDFKVQTEPGTERLARAAFEYARKNGKHNVTIVTKSNIVKLTDGSFAKCVHRIGETEYPDIDVQERLVDAMAAKMMDPEYSAGCEVFILPNLYGDIVTDVAAEYQGGLGTASSSNIGSKYAVFEAIHGVANFLMRTGRSAYADPCSLIRAAGELLVHIGYADRKAKLDRALDICTITEKKLIITTDRDGASAAEFTDYLLETLAAV